MRSTKRIPKNKHVWGKSLQKDFDRLLGKVESKRDKPKGKK